jgi:uridylate kinase
MTNNNSELLYRRVLLKISGEALKDNTRESISAPIMKRLAAEVAELITKGVEVSIVPGAGNYFRGVQLAESGLSRITGDHMGMVATIINALALRDVFENNGIETRVMSALPLNGMVEPFERRKAMYQLLKNRVVIIPGGTGNPLVTTDSAASLRAVEIEANALLKATNVEGIYSADPVKEKSALLYQDLTYKQALDKELAVMDLAAFCQCRDYGMEIRVFNIEKPGILNRVVTTYDEGTTIRQ